MAGMGRKQTLELGQTVASLHIPFITSPPLLRLHQPRSAAYPGTNARTSGSSAAERALDLADHVKRLAGVHHVARGTVAKVVNANVRQTCLPARRVPSIEDCRYRCIAFDELLRRLVRVSALMCSFRCPRVGAEE